MKKLSIVMIISTAIMFIVFAALLPRFKNVFLLYIPFMVNYLVFFLLAFFIARKYLSFTFDSKIFKKLIHYGAYALIIVVATVFLGNVDKIMINYFLTSADVGTYQAYFNSSIVAVGILIGIFVKVFFPTASKFKDKKSILKRLNKLSIPVAAGLALFLPLFIFIVISLYGYKLSILTIILFTTATIFDFLVVTHVALLNSISVESIKRTSVGMVIIFSGNIILNYFLIPQWGINGAIISTNISFLALFLYIYYYLKKMV
jgi:O-antigen/teichoic acid export membrane protein